MIIPQTPYRTIKLYEIPINDGSYRFCSLVSEDDIVMWMPDTEQQHVNPQYRDSEFNKPVRVSDLKIDDINQIIQQILLFKLKEKVSLEYIVSGHGRLARQMLNDFILI